MSDERLLRILDRVDAKSPDAVQRVARVLAEFGLQGLASVLQETAAQAAGGPWKTLGEHEAALQKVHAALASKLAADADGTGIHFTREEGLALEAVAYREISHLFPAPLTTKRAPVMSPAERREADAAEEQRQADAAGRVNVVPRFWPGEF